jgi:cholesterol oxidase
LLLEGLAEGERMLGVGPAPDPERFAKFHGMRRLADAAGVGAHLPAMTIAHRDTTIPSGVQMQACRYCGDCWSGCNAGAKITTAVSYVADACNHGAEVFCNSQVNVIAKTVTGWTVNVQNLAAPGSERQLEADLLVLAAGTLGTSELLLRARERGLPLSHRLGFGFSANGDDLAFADKQVLRVNAVATGFPSKASPGAPLVGPHSMAIVDLGDEHGPVWVHDGTMLAIMASLAPIAEALSLRFKDAYKILRQGIYGDELGRSQVLYIVAQDDASGRVQLQNDRVVVDWPGYSSAPDRVRAEQKVRALVERAGAVFNSNPFAMTAFGGNRIIAHPLGGCGMGETVESGVVAHDGRVFDPTKGPTGVYDGLYVLDGAAIPSSVGVSPLLTITALAERAMTLTAVRLGRSLDRGHRAIPARPHTSSSAFTPA